MTRFLFPILSFISLVSFSQNPLWLRYPSISPNGKTISFNYKGDIYIVPVEGGNARAITTHKEHDFMSTWSADGKNIAFASNRYGNYDVFVMAAAGGAAMRLTHHSANDYPNSFDTNNNVLFSSTRLDSYLNSQFPSGSLNELYSINKDGELNQILTTPAERAQWNKTETKLLYQDRKGYENQWR